MAVVAHTFTHLDRRFIKGAVVDDADELVTAAPHLFVQPDPAPEVPERKPGRIRGPLVNQKKER